MGRCDGRQGKLETLRGRGECAGRLGWARWELVGAEGERR
jgi:hypothetical protein